MSTLDLLKELLERFDATLKQHEDALEKNQLSLALQYLEEAKGFMEQVREIAFQTGTEELVTQSNDSLETVTHSIDILKSTKTLSEQSRKALASSRMVH